MLYSLILLLLALLFGVSLFKSLQKPSEPDNQIVSQTQSPSPTQTSMRIVNGIQGILDPQQVAATSGANIRLTYSLHNLKEPVVAADLLLTYDPSKLEFVTVEGLNPNFSNPRQLDENGRIVLSFVEKLGVTQPKQESIILAELVFRSQQPGTTTISPILNQEAASSMVLTSNSNDNQLSSLNKVQIVIQ